MAASNLPKTSRAFKKFAKFIDETDADVDGCWVYLRTGWHNGDPGNHYYHEDTWAEVLQRMNDFPPQPCKCDDCRLRAAIFGR